MRLRFRLLFRPKSFSGKPQAPAFLVVRRTVACGLPSNELRQKSIADRGFNIIVTGE